MDTAYPHTLPSLAVRPRILVVDDQTINIRLVGEIFKGDCDIYMAMDGEQGIAQCQATLPDLVLLDLVMPGIDGYEVCRRLKADPKTEHIPIIFITSQRDEADEARGFELGAVDYVTKPFNQTVLRARVQTHIVQKLQADRLRTSERFMCTLTDSVPALITYWNVDLVCTFSNASCRDYYGRTPAQMVGISPRELMGDSLFNKSKKFIEATLQGQSQQFERTMTKWDGNMVFVWVQYIPDIEDGRVQGFTVLISDISELKRAQLALAESEQFVRTTIDTVPETICVLNNAGVIIAVNQAWRDFYDANCEDPRSVNYALGANYLKVCELASSADVGAAEMAQGLAAVLAGEREEFSVEYPCDSPTEKRFYFARVKRFAGGSGNVLVAHGNVTGRKMMELELARMAHTDVLTNLNNRRHYLQLSETELSRISRYGGVLSVLMLDIDHFKQINDTHGHQTGDSVIQLLAAICREELRDLDVIGRIGGEEFAVTMPNADYAQAMQIAERLRQAIDAASVPLPQGPSLRFTVSMGVTTLSKAQEPLQRLLDQADQALYQAKKSGRNRVCGYGDNG